jgi:hypothetical protein
VIRGSVALAKGAIDDAEKHLRSAVEYAVADDSGITMVHIDVADVLILESELDEAAALLTVIFEDAPANSTPWLAAHPVAAALALAHGDLPRARTLLDETTTLCTISAFAWPRYTLRLNSVRTTLTT